MRLAAVLCGVALLPAMALAKPPPGTVIGSPENLWWQAQKQADGVVSCGGAPGADGHVLQPGDWKPNYLPTTGAHESPKINAAFPWLIKVYWRDHPDKFTWMPVPAAVQVPPQDLPEPDVALRGLAKVWFAPGWAADGSPIAADFYWFCLEIPESM